MLRVYTEVFSKENQCFLNAREEIDASKIARASDRVERDVKVYKDCGYEVQVVVETNNLVVFKVESDDFIEIKTISELEVQ